MLKINNLFISIEDMNENQNNAVLKAASARLKIGIDKISEIGLIKKSLDARKEKMHFTVSAYASICGNENIFLKIKDVEKYIPTKNIQIRRVNKKSRPVVAGFGPAGIFAAYVLARAGMEPIILERGYDVDTRKKDVGEFWQKGIFNPKSNVQFGEGGAGTFSDGKLTTGIKSQYTSFILTELVRHGAPEAILYDAKPHIGTDKLSETVKNIRREIINCGGEIIFGARLTDISFNKDNQVTVAVYENNEGKHELVTEDIVLAIGHSARDTVTSLYAKGIIMSGKAFSVGVRIEHVAEEINRALYGDYREVLPAADYKLSVRTSSGRGVYTFCMCPGGYVVASASEKFSVVTNGMSYYKRDNVNSNSALLVSVTPEDFPQPHALSGIDFQRRIEQAAFVSGGNNYNAPAFLTGDFLERKISEGFGKVLPSYTPGTGYVPPDEYLPKFVSEALREAIPMFGRKIKGFDAPYSVLTGPETRSSSPVRIERNPESLEAFGKKGLYPCGEGAGYAGGIISAAVDGIKTAMAIIDRV